MLKKELKKSMVSAMTPNSAAARVTLIKEKEKVKKHGPQNKNKPERKS